MDIVSYIVNTFICVIAVGLVQPVFNLSQYENERDVSFKQDVEGLLSNSQKLHYIEDRKMMPQSIANNLPTIGDIKKSVEDIGEKITLQVS